MDIQEVIQEIRNAIHPDPPTQAPTLSSSANSLRGLVAVRDGYKLESLPGPEVPQRRHEFASVRSFGQWLRRHAQPDKVDILISPTEIVAALDPTNPAADVVRCKLDPHPRAKAWLDAFQGRVFSQRDLFLFVRGRIADFQDAKDKNGVSIGSQGSVIAAELQKLEIVKGGKLETRLDGFGGVVFNAAEANSTVSGKLPPSFGLRLPLLRDVLLAGVDTQQEPAYEIEVHLTMSHEEGKKPEFSLCAPSVELAQLAALEDARRCLEAQLSAALSEGYLVGLGRFATAVVPVPVSPSTSTAGVAR